ncbi:MAG TPA: DNA internalization-related competence protein ComEC/Rec2 [Candidatus Faecousia intestinigallinarum]|nr:DNA internalization-related competence protein ComEC/Rec2 [Candidatus Faecousia intestinigallinarum]
MRILMWFSIGFCGACGAFAYLPGSGLGAPILAAVLAAAAIALWVGRERMLRPLVCALLGCALGLGWFACFDGIYLAPPKTMDGRTEEAAILLRSYSYPTEYGQAAGGEVTLAGKTYRLRVYLDCQESLPPGTVVEGAFRFQLTTGTGNEERTSHSGKGEFLLAYAAGEVSWELPQSKSLRYLPEYARQYILTRIEMFLPPDVGVFARALLLGDTAQLDYETDTALQLSGVRHVVAVSGMHVSILCGLLLFLSCGKRFLAVSLCLPALLLFTAMAGFTPSVSRAAIMVSLSLLAMVLRREYDPPTALSFAALVILIVNPWAVTSVSFQLSVSCVAGILLFSGRIYGYLESRFFPAKKRIRGKRLLRLAAASLSVTLGAMSLSTPLSAYYFGMVSLAGIFANLLGLWAVSLAFYGILAVVIFGSVFAPLGSVFAWLTTLLIRYFILLTKFLSAFPLSAVYTRSREIVWWLVSCYLLLGLLLVMKKKQPALFLAMAAFGLTAALTISWLLPLTEQFRVTVLDVGQGQCVVLQSGGRTYLVDCGGDYGENAADIAAEYLLSQGIFRLDGLILTHFDEDHAGGAAFLAARIPVEAVFYPDTELPSFPVLADYPVTVQTTLTYGESKITIFPGNTAGGSNETSLCVLFQVGNCDILITGDQTEAGEKALLCQTDLPELEMLVVGHHGAKTSTGEALLRKTKPLCAVISVGADNPYGHPAQEVLARLKQFGCTVLRTDEMGTIIFRG